MTTLYVPQWLNFEKDNTGYAYLGMVSGDMMVYEVSTNSFPPLEMLFKSLFPFKPGDMVTDIKQNPFKIHRFLVSLE